MTLLKNKTLYTIICIFLTTALQGCGAESKGEKNDTPTSAQRQTVPTVLVGEWIYVDNGKEFYLGANSDLNYTLVDNNLIEIPTDKDFNRYAIRSGINNSTVTGSVHITSESQSASIASSEQRIFTAQSSSGVSGIAGIDVILQNIEDDSVTITTTTDNNGNFNTDTVPSGDYTIKANNQNGSFETETSISGLDTDLGIYTLNDESEYNFKATIKIDFLYGDYQEVRGFITIHNIGTKRGDGLSYTFGCGPELNELIESCEIENEPGSIDPDSSKSFPIRIKLKYLTSDIEKISIPVAIRDFRGTEWNDYVNITAYKRFTNINIKANSSSVSGYLISPGQLPLSINTRNSTIKVPYLPGKQYQLVFSNTSISRETAYSVGIDTVVNDIEGFDDTGSFEPNNSESQAIPLSPLKAISSYLHIGDIDYYTIDMPVDFTQSAKLEFYSLVPLFDGDNFGNGDGVLSKGETIKFDFAIKNSSFINVEDVIVEISSEDPFITVGSARKFSPQDFDSNTVTDTEGYYKGHEYFGNGNSNAGFIATASLDTPENHKATVNVTMTDKFGNQWFDTFQLSTQKTAANLVFNSISNLYDVNYRDANGNNDSILNQGETARFNLAIENTGSSAAINAILEISTNDKYLTVENVTDTSRRMTSIYPSTIVDSNTYVKGGRYDDHFLNRDYNTDFSIAAETNTPAGHTATIDLKMTDKFGNIWTDSFEITVEGIAADLKFHGISPFFDKTIDDSVGNDDSILNAGETADITVAIKNLGTSPAIDVAVNMESESPYISVLASTETTGRTQTVEAGSIIDTDQKQSTDPDFLRRDELGDFRLKAEASTPSGHIAVIKLTMTDKFENTWSDTFSVTVQ